MNVKSNYLEFELFQEALPFPVKEDIQEVLEMVPFQENVNNEILVVTKLKKGNYSLQIDELEVGQFTSQQLKEGINLAEYSNTPQYQQAEKISELCFEYRKVQSDLRTIAHIEYKMLADYIGPNTLKDKKQFLDDKVESQKGKSWYNYMKNQCKDYFEILPREKELWNELKKIRTEIYSQNKPVEHTYKIIKNQAL